MAAEPSIAKKKKSKDYTRKNYAFSRAKFAGDSPLERMILALSDEIDFEDKNARKQVLKNGVLSEEMGGLFLYEFDIGAPFEFDPDEDIGVAIGGRDFRGRVVRVEFGKVVIGVDESQGSAITKVEVMKAENMMEKLLRNQLVAIFDGKKEFNKKQADLAVGVGEPEIVSVSNVKTIGEFESAQGFSLNTGQTNFITKSQKSDLVLLWGPPGTGKTMCIGILTASLLEEGKRVLIASNTNKAVDGAIGTVLETQNDLGNLKEDTKILRFGGQGITDEFKRDWNEHLFEVELDKLGEEIKLEEERLGLNRAQIIPEISRLLAELDDIEALRTCVADLSNIQKDLPNKKRQIEKLGQRLSEQKKHKTELLDEWVKAPEQINVAGRLVGRRTKEEIRNELDEIEVKITELEEEAGLTNAELANLVSNERKISGEIPTLEHKVGSYPDEQHIRAQKAELQEELDDINKTLKELQDRLEGITRTLIRESGVIATTVHKIFLDPNLSEVDFDVVIIDEASMVILPMVYWAAGRAKSQLVVVGDFRQLPAIVKDTDSELVSEWLGASPFDKWGIPDVVKTARSDEYPFLVVLQMQNRMHPEIGGLVSELFYSDINTPDGVGLMPGPVAEAQARKAFRMPGQKTEKRITIVDTCDLGAWSSPPFGGKGRFNPTHVSLGLALLDRLIAEALVERGKKDQIGFVTPYSGQAKLYADTLGDSYEGYCDQTSVGTAHRFQGGERKIIIFDYVLSENRDYHNQFIDSKDGFDQPGNLLNVALSRAKQHLLIIFNSDEFTKKNTHPWMLDFFTLLNQRAEKLDAKELLDESDLEAVVQLGNGAVQKNISNIPYTETGFYKKIREDLSAAKEKVFIFSAYVTPHGLARWLDVFQILLRRGVKIRLVTKPVSDQPKPKTYHAQLTSMFEKIRESGIILDNRHATHEKIVVIDEEVVWHGSLNMFSQDEKRTTEIMTRSVSKEYANSIVGLLARHDLKQNDLYKSQLPVCPTCNSPTKLNINWQKTLETLFCSQDCGFIAGSWDFSKLSRGVPLGRHLHKCEVCKDGIIKVAIVKGKYIGRCSNARNKKGDSCDHKEEYIKKSQLQCYDPYPAPPERSPDALTSLIEGKNTKTDNREPAPSDGHKPQTQKLAKKAIRTTNAKRSSLRSQKTKTRRSTGANKPLTSTELDTLLSSINFS